MERSLRGFTLVELLVVITIIGMLVGMLLPAVNMARESGRRTTCSNNLHQLSAACMGHVQKLGFYPSGGWGSNWVGNPDCGTGANQPGGWIYQILPYIDQDTLHELGRGGVTSVSSSASATRVATSLQVLYCPTRRAVAPYPIATANNGKTTAQMAGRTDYAINGGSNYIAHGAGPSSVAAATSYNWPSLATFNGIASVHSQVTEAMVTDNKGTTYLIGEKYMSPENYTDAMVNNNSTDNTTGQIDPGDSHSAMSGDDVSLIRWGNDTWLPSMDHATNNSATVQANPSKIFGSTAARAGTRPFAMGTSS